MFLYTNRLSLFLSPQRGDITADFLFNEDQLKVSGNSTAERNSARSITVEATQNVLSKHD